MFIDQMSVSGRDHFADPLQIFLYAVEHTRENFAIPDLSIQLFEHLIWIVCRCDGFVSACVAHAGPCVGAIRDHDTKFQRSESSSRFFL